MKRKISYLDVCQAFGNFLESGTKETLLKSLNKGNQLETLEEKKERLYNRIEFLHDSLNICGRVLRRVLYPKESLVMEEQLEAIRKRRIEGEEGKELEKVFTIVEKLDYGLEDVLEYLKDPSSHTEEKLSRVERLINKHLPTLAHVLLLVGMLGEKIEKEYSRLLSYLDDKEIFEALDELETYN